MYSHRSTFLHSMMVTSTANIALAESDRMLVIVPMFHANAWGTPYAAWMVGADLVFPQQFLQAAPLSRIIEETRPTLDRRRSDRADRPADQRQGGRPVVAAAGDVRWFGGAASLDPGLPRRLRRTDRAGLGNDRDQSGVRDRSSTEGHGGTTTRSHGGRRTGRILPGVELRITDDSGDDGSVGRRVARRDRGARAVDHGLVLPASTIPTSSTTVGCAPATSPRCHRTAT